MDNRIEYQTIILAALLHDIGKFLQRGRNLPFKIEGTHPEISGQFVRAFSSVFKNIADVQMLNTLVVHHHRDKSNNLPVVEQVTNPRHQTLAYIVNKADGLSSSERGDRAEGYKDYQTTPLVPVFHRVYNTPDPKNISRYHPFYLTEAGKLKHEELFPVNLQSYGTGELENTISAFGKAWSQTFRTDDNNFDTVLSHILALLHSYTLALPANTQEGIPDTSLFDHMKTTAAIAACLYQTYEANNDWEYVKREDNTPRFMLVVGDVSGIQKYVFEIAGTDRSGRGVARRLRARSLFVQLISEIAPLQILKTFELPLTNILMASGGKFYLLLPASPETNAKLEDYERNSAEWFRKNLNASLGLNLAWTTCDESGLGKGFGTTLKQVMYALDIKKEQSFKPSLINNQWIPTAFTLSPFGEDKRACRSCGKFAASEDELCPQCSTDLDWGKTLPGADLIAIALDRKSEGRNLLDAGIALGGDGLLKSNPSFVININKPDTTSLSKYPTSFRYLAKYVPIENGEPMDFQKIALQNHGRKYLAFLKVDVDNLGGIFAFGLRGKEEQWDTPSRVATMSRQLDLFFTGWVEHLLESEFKDCYCVFSGGDDLFIIGPWNQALGFVTKLNQDFTKYTCQNKSITLSAGMVIESHSYPVSQAAEEASDAVEESKHEGKNRLTLLGHTVTWEEWASIKKLWEDLREEKINSAFLYSLLDYAAMWQEYSKWIKTSGKEGSVLGLRFQPLLAYNLRRNLNRRNNQQVYDWAEKLLEWRPNSGKNDIERTLNNLGLIAQLLILWKGG